MLRVFAQLFPSVPHNQQQKKRSEQQQKTGLNNASLDEISLIIPASVPLSVWVREDVIMRQSMIVPTKGWRVIWETIRETICETLCLCVCVCARSWASVSQMIGFVWRVTRECVCLCARVMILFLRTMCGMWMRSIKVLINLPLCCGTRTVLSGQWACEDAATAESMKSLSVA